MNVVNKFAFLISPITVSRCTGIQIETDKVVLERGHHTEGLRGRTIPWVEFLSTYVDPLCQLWQGQQKLILNTGITQ